jgi:RimJ/RimL family protein N-acetyltransferase
LLTDPQVRRHLLDGEVVSRAFVERMVADSAQSFARRGHGLYAAADPGGAMLGVCGFHLIGVPPERQLVYAFTPPSWGQGLASEAVRAVVAHAEGTCGLKEIVATTDADNLASIAVLRKCGFLPRVELIERGRTIRRFVRRC